MLQDSEVVSALAVGNRAGQGMAVNNANKIIRLGASKRNGTGVVQADAVEIERFVERLLGAELPALDGPGQRSVKHLIQPAGRARQLHRRVDGHITIEA